MEPSRSAISRMCLFVVVPFVLALCFLLETSVIIAAIGLISPILIGHYIACWLTKTADGNLLRFYVESRFSASSNKIVLTKSGDYHNDSIRKLPWDGLLVSEPVSDAIEQFLEQVVDRFVSNWYEAGISRDRAFLHEIKYQLRFACCRLLRRLSFEDICSAIVEDVVPLASLHFHKVGIALDEIDKHTPPSVVETEIAQRVGPLHYALGSRTNEVDYLGQLSDFLLPLLLDDTRLAGRSLDDDSPRRNLVQRTQRAWPSQPCKHVLRELVVHGLLLPLLDLAADPDTLNRLLILLFDPEPEVLVNSLESRLVPFLHGLTAQAMETVPDSLLQLKLSELIRDAKMFSMLRLYLQDTRGPVNELLFLAEADRIHEAIQKKADCSSQITYDIWQIYSQFVHEGAPEKIPFDEEVVTEFRTAVEGSNLERLERVLETSYQWIYGRLQWDQVVPFCQSESFLGHLCGSPPVALDELCTLIRLDRARSSVTEKTFSLAQFRSRLRKAIALSFDADDASLGNEIADGIVVENDFMEANQDVVETEFTRGSLKCPRLSSDDTALTAESLDSSCLPLHSLSMPDFQLPSIDVSHAVEDLSVASPSNALDRKLEASMDSYVDSQCDVERTALTDEGTQFIVDQETRNMGRWTITIPRIVPTRDPLSLRTVYVYAVQVIRQDAQPHETAKWTVLRRFNEFYILEAKLTEFHGETLRIPTLPPRKTFVTKTRVFVEQHRLCFAAFLANLCRQRQLCRSDLLYAFLASTEEFRDSLLLSDLNPWKVVKKVPGRLSRERGQNLRPFLLGMLASTLVSPQNDANSNRRRDNNKAAQDTSDSSSASSLFLEGKPPLSLYSPVFGNNFFGSQFTMEPNESSQWSRSPFDAVFLLSRIFVCVMPSLIFSMLSAVRTLCRNSIDFFIRILTEQALRTALSDIYLIRLVRLAEHAIFIGDGTYTTEQEKSLRCELAKRRTVEWLEDRIPGHLKKVLGGRQLRTNLLKLLNELQFARLNKQLSYVLLDSLVRKLFPDNT